MNKYLKITALVLLSLICLGGFYFEINEFNKNRVAHKGQVQYHDNLVALSSVVELVFSLQRERGMSTGFESEAEHSIRLKTYHQETDAQVTALLSETSANLPSFNLLKSTIENDIKNLRDTRQNTTTDREQLFLRYTILITKLIDIVRMIQTEQTFIRGLSDTGNVEYQNIYGLVRAIELGGKLRAKVSRFLTAAEQDTRLLAMRSALQFYSTHLSLLESLKGNLSTKTLYSNASTPSEFNYLRNQMSNFNQGVNNDVPQYVWWDNSTAYLNLLADESKVLLSEMQLLAAVAVSQTNNSAQVSLVLSCMIALFYIILTGLLIRTFSALTLYQATPIKMQTAQLVVIFSSVLSVLFVEHFASQKQLLYLSELQTQKQLNQDVLQRINSLKIFWYKPTTTAIRQASVDAAPLPQQLNSLNIIQLNIPSDTYYFSKEQVMVLYAEHQNQLRIHEAQCEIFPRELFNAQLITSQQFDYLVITAEAFQQLTTEGKEVFIATSRCKYILLDNSQAVLPSPTNISVSHLSLYPYYAYKVVSHIAALEGLIELESTNEVTSHPSNISMPRIEEAQAQNQLILVVEDNLYNQDLFKRQLAMLGYQCIIADNGKVALQLIEQYSFALIITDCHMPIMDGYEFAKTRRTQEQTQGLHYLPIIAATANALSGERQVCIDAGMDDYIAKPIVLQKLNAKLKKWITTDIHHNADTAISISAPAVDNPQELHHIDLAILSEYVGTDKEIQSIFLKSFVSDTKNLFDQVDLSLPERIRDMAHQGKTSAKAVGATQLAGKLAELEESIKDGRPEKVEALLNYCLALFDNAQAEIASILSVEDIP
ncbi:response regulator [Pseudoalteromonas sp. SCSIO 43201]|uniref:response regulator n=1 Tax=Pseudoalteromonas sp. SCSIO 43201 TaxID=2822842 RepID=UPI0020753786|nr:response regulator [Pseudoalteromonas sp. SCSIO 43201]USD30959.1 response regulator [Pseudoalteromonas sp. SCSIO 43201]